MSESNGAKPEFDYSDLSWDESVEVELLQMKIRKAQADNDADGYRGVVQDLRLFYAKITVSIPREWLVKSAPAIPDLTDPKTYGFLRSDKVLDFLTLAVQAKAPEATTKN